MSEARIGPLVAWIGVRCLLALAALVAAVAQAGPAVGLALAVAVAFLRPLRRGWLAALPVLAVAPWAPVAAALLAARALFSEAFLLAAGGRTETGGMGTAARRGRGLGEIHRMRRALLVLLKLPVASVTEADQRLAAARRGSGSLETAALSTAGAYWAEGRPWGLLLRAPEVVLAIFGGVFADDDGGGDAGASLVLAKGLFLESVGPSAVALSCTVVACLVGVFLLPEEPVSLGPVEMPGAVAQLLALLVLSLAAATVSLGWLLIGVGLAWVLVRSHLAETILIAALAGIAAAAARAALRRLVVAGRGKGRAREPFRGPRRLRRRWRAGVEAAEQGRLPVAISLLEGLFDDPTCGEARAQVGARLALCLFDAGDLDAAASTLARSRAAGELPTAALPAAGSTAAGLGDLETAELLLRRALDELPRRSRLRDRATLSLADVCARRRRPNEAIELIVARRADPWSYDGIGRLLDSEALIATALVRQGEVERAKGRLEEILDLDPVEAAMGTGLSGERRRELIAADARVRLVAGEIALAQGQLARAEHSLRGAVGRLDRHAEPHLYACTRALHGVALVLRATSEEGLREIDEGIGLLEARRTLLRRADHRTGLILAEADLYGWCFKALERAAKQGASGAPESAAWLIESLHKSALAQMLRADDAEPSAEAGRLLDRIGELERSPTTEAEIERGRAELAAALSDQFAAAYVPTPTSVDALRELAEACGDILAFHLPDGVLPGWRVWIGRDGTFEVDRIEVIDPDAAALLDGLAAGETAGIVALHAPLAATTAWAAIAEALLPRPLAEALRRRTDGEPPPLLIAPDGVLGLLPWSALLLDGSPLGTVAAVQVVPSLSVVDLGVEEEKEEDRSTAVAFLDPSLEGQDRERQLLEDNFDLTVASTRAELVATLRRGGFDGAYLAAHGSGVGLAQSVDLDDGPLSAGAALQAPWPAWTMFASCLVGRVPFEAGAEPLGLPISCVLAGSQSVLSAMVEVPSATLPALVEPILAGLAAGKHPARALAEAQRAYLADNPHASVVECLAFVCMTRSARPAPPDTARLDSWAEVVRTAEAAAETDPARAREIFQTGLAAWDPDPSLLARYAFFLANAGENPEEAGEILEAAVASHPDHVELRRIHAWYLHRHLDDVERTRAAYEAVFDLDPDDRWASGEFARFLRVRTGELELSALHYRRALALRPDWAPYARALGEVLARSGDPEGARRMYERALRQDPNLLGACMLLAELVGREEKDADRVARLFERSIRRGPKGAAGRFQRWAMVAVKDLDDRALARRLFERGRRDDPDDPYLTVNLAWLLFEVGEDERAIPLAKHALAQTDQPEVRLEAWFYLAAFGDPALAREARHRAEELIADGARSEGWDLSRIVARAKRESRDADWVERTAATIAGPAAAADGGPT